MKISLAMIVQNEALTILRTIDSVRKYVDEIVIGLDTKTSDGTDKILQDLQKRDPAVTLIRSYLSEELEKKAPHENYQVQVWDNNKWVKGKKKLTLVNDQEWGFGAARSRVFEVCDPNNWRLVLDGHEVVLHPERIRTSVAEAIKKGCDGIDIWLHFEPRGPVGTNSIPNLMYSQIRLMAPSVKYNNSYHNVPTTTNDYVDHEIIIEHRKKDQDPASRAARDKQRSGSNIEGLKQKLRIDSNNARSWFYLGEAFQENARPAEAVKAFEECLVYSRWNEERYHARLNAGNCYRALGKINEARDHFVRALEEYPLMVEAYYYLADMAYKQQLFREAEVWLDHCIDMPIPNCQLFVDPEIYMLLRYDLMAMNCSHLGQNLKGLKYAEKVLEVDPSERAEANVSSFRDSLTAEERKIAIQTEKPLPPPKFNNIVHYCDGMDFYGKRLESIYNYSKYDPQTDITSTVLFEGLYFEDDYTLFRRHIGPIRVFWNGSDVSRLLANPQWQKMVKNKVGAEHFCHNGLLASELATINIQATVYPIFFGDVKQYKPSFRPATAFPAVYLVAHPEREDEYGVNTVLTIAQALPDFHFHIYGVDGRRTHNVVFHGQVDEEVMDKEIVNFQGCLRLNAHDGFSQTVMKSILLAQYPICHQNIPGVMCATTTEDIIACLKTLKTYKEPNLELRSRYLDIFSRLPF